MRIISGKFKGTLLDRRDGKNTRPLKDSTKESIFNLLAHSKNILFKLERKKILDLYSGTGSFGLECLSREAIDVHFIENEKDAINILKKNINKLNFSKKAKITQEDVLKAIEKELIVKEKFDLIFCDPPFKFLNINKLLTAIHNKKLLVKKGIIILHRNKKSKDIYPDFFKITDERVYGISKIIFGSFLS